jgi:hypothetical protein
MSEANDIIRQMNEYANDLERRNSALQLALIAGESFQFMGVPVQVHLEWPNGVPQGFEDEERLQMWAQRKLAEIRESESDDRRP